jgi:hypothetical protein
VPSVLKVVKKANEHKIPYGLMETLNFTDLQAMIIDYDIDALEQMKRDKENSQKMTGINYKKVKTWQQTQLK